MESRKRKYRTSVKCSICNTKMNSDHFKKHNTDFHDGKASFSNIVQAGQTLLQFSSSKPKISAHESPEENHDNVGRHQVNVNVQSSDPVMSSDSESNDDMPGVSDNPVSPKSIVLTDIATSPQRLIDVSMECEMSDTGNDSHNISQSEEFLLVSDSDEDEISSVESITNCYLSCIGRLRDTSENLSSLLSRSGNLETHHAEVAMIDIRDTCVNIQECLKDVISDTNKNLDRIRSCQPEASPGESCIIEHDPALRPKILTENQKKFLIAKGPCQPDLKSDFPKKKDMLKEKQHKQCSFAGDWYKCYPYIEYSISADKAYCFICGLFGREGIGSEKSELTWIDGINDWKKMKGSRGKNKPGKLETHFSCRTHTIAYEKYIHFINEQNHVDSLISKDEERRLISEEQEHSRNRQVIEMLLDVVNTLCRNGMPLRGNHDTKEGESGNFTEFVKLLGRHNPIMKSWLENQSLRKYRVSYLSSQSQREFLKLIATDIKSTVTEKVKESGYYSVMADTTPDVSNVDELSVSVRYVDKTKCVPEERIIAMEPTFDKSGAGQAQDIVKCLKEADLPLSNLQFQTYDSTSSMSGIYNGAQQKLNEILGREVPYTKCSPHGTNLVVEHASDSSNIISKVYKTLESLNSFFSKSPKRDAELKKNLDTVENSLQLQCLSQTRWSARADAVEAVWRSFEAILEVLTTLSSWKDGDTANKASGLKNNMLNIDFLCGIMLLKNVLIKTKILSDYLQKETIDISAALGVIKATKANLISCRSETQVNNEIEACLLVAKSLGFDPLVDFKKLYRRWPIAKVTDPDIVKSKIISFYRVEYYKVLDSLIRVMGEKEDHLITTFAPFLDVLHPGNKISVEQVRAVCEKHPCALPIDTVSSLHAELEVFFKFAQSEYVKSDDYKINNVPISISYAAELAMNYRKDHGLFKLAANIYHLFVTAAPSVCNNERSFSSLKRIKNKLRNSMSPEMLNHVMIICTEKDLAQKLNLSSLAKKWYMLKKRRIVVKF